MLPITANITQLSAGLLSLLSESQMCLRVAMNFGDFMSAYDVGFDDYFANKQIGDNPYPDDSDDACDWQLGWLAAEESTNI